MAEQLTVSAAVTADLSSFRREMGRGPGIARTFSRDVGRAVAGSLTAPRINAAAYSTQGTAAGRAFARGVEREVATSRPFDGLTAQARTAAGAVGAVFVAREAITAADAWTNAGNRLGLVATSAGEVARTQRELFDIAQQTRTAFGGTVDIYSRLARSARDLGATRGDLLAVSRAINQAATIGGGSQGGIDAALFQLGQGLGSGVVRAEELNSVLEQTPRLAQAIADGLTNGSIPALREMSAAGELTSARLFGALRGQAGVIGAEFEGMTSTIGQGFTQVGNSFTRYIGQSSEASGAGRVLSGTLTTVAENFDTAANAALGFGAVMAARTIGNVSGRVLADLREQTAARRAEEQAIVRTTFAQQADAAAAEAAAAADVRRTERRIANLTRVEAAIARQAAAERTALANAATIVAQTSTPGALPAGLPGVARELARREQAQATVERSSRVLLQLEQQQIATSQRLGAQTAILATQQTALGSAQTVASAQTAAHTAAIGTQTLAARAGALAVRGLTGALAFFGGPIGATITAVGAAVAYVTTRTTAAERAARTYADELGNVTRRANEAGEALDRMTRDQAGARNLELSIDLDAARGAMAEIREELRGATTGGARDFFGKPDATAYNRALGAVRRDFLAGRTDAEQFAGAVSRVAERFPQFREEAGELLAVARSFQLAESRANSLTRTIKQLRAAQARPVRTAAAPAAPVRLDVTTLDDEVAQLAKLRESGVQAGDVVARIGTITRAASAQLRTLTAQPLTDSTRAAMVEVQGVLDALTGTTRADREIKTRLTADTRDAEQAAREFRERAEQTSVRVRLLMDSDAAPARLTAAVAALRTEYEAVRTAADAPNLSLERANELLRTQIDLATTLGDVYDRANRAAILAPPPGGYTTAPGPIAPRVEIATDAERATAAMAGAVRQGERLATTLSRIGTSGRGLTNLTRFLGGVQDELRDVLDGAFGVVDAFEELTRLRAAQNAARLDNPFDLTSAASGLAGFLTVAPAVIGAVGGLVGIVGGLLNRGPSATELALRNNAQVTERLTAELANVRATWGNLTRVGGAATAVGSADRFTAALGAGSSVWELVGGRLNWDTVNAQLLRFGTNMTEVRALADEFGITILDGNRVIQPALVQLGEALDLARTAAMRWGTTLGDRFDQQAFRTDVLDLDVGPGATQQALTDAAAVIRTEVPALYQRLFTGIDVNTDTGRTVLNERLNALVAESFGADFTAQRGPLFEMLRGTAFEGIGDFQRIIRTTDDALDAFAEGLTAATASTYGMAAGFRKEFAEGLSWDVVRTAPTATVPTPTLPPTPAESPTRSRRAEDDLVQRALDALNHVSRPRPDEPPVWMRELLASPRATQAASSLTVNSVVQLGATPEQAYRHFRQRQIDDAMQLGGPDAAARIAAFYPAPA